ncbi:class I SAM-dependent methyltransferase [Actinomadura barringtoniae]|uniref:Class I SAM-dependent methyltransferase n=1 Tax=Actinomadura barringtoniae TaxID=1427535 RepID=A0A939PIG8_9ACTN|nr:class I SAM-dependent methyltransferase [Actinomadura barringtoniae]MBO2450678.1 class I SAM-dependent methyltransferase [Actinomadura barringtoniae]
MDTETTGKVSLDHIYSQPDPRAYFDTLRELGYCIPQLAKPHFAELIADYREAAGVAAPTILDIGCSYGINAALLRCDATMDDLYERYCDRAFYAHDTLVSRDREFVRDRGRPGTRFMGLDASDSALSYALETGFIDEAVHTDLEAGEPTESQRERLAAADLVVSTGCVGYVTERTISRIARAHGERLPWMAHFVLRMFPFEPVADSLAEAGYKTVRHEGVFKQRRFATPEEHTQVLDTLSSVGVDPHGLETDGWLYAQLYLSRPTHPERGSS